MRCPVVPDPQAVLESAGVLRRLLPELGAHLGPLLECEYLVAAAFVPFLEALQAQQEPDEALAVTVSLLQPHLQASQVRPCPACRAMVCTTQTHLLAC